MSTRISFIRSPAPVSLIPSPRPVGFVSYDTIIFKGWDMARPEIEVECCGLNERQAIDDAAIRLGAPGWRIRVRRALPESTSLPSLRLA